MTFDSSKQFDDDATFWDPMAWHFAETAADDPETVEITVIGRYALVRHPVPAIVAR